MFLIAQMILFVKKQINSCNFLLSEARGPELAFNKLGTAFRSLFKGEADVIRILKLFNLQKYGREISDSRLNCARKRSFSHSNKKFKVS